MARYKKVEFQIENSMRDGYMTELTTGAERMSAATDLNLADSDSFVEYLSKGIVIKVKRRAKLVEILDNIARFIYHETSNLAQTYKIGTTEPSKDYQYYLIAGEKI